MFFALCNFDLCIHLSQAKEGYLKEPKNELNVTSNIQVFLEQPHFLHYEDELSQSINEQYSMYIHFVGNSKDSPYDKF
jgi:hypothetical protein